MICVNSFDQKVGELHVWGSNVVWIRCHYIDGGASEIRRTCDRIYKDNQWIFHRLRHDRKNPNNGQAAESNTNNFYKYFHNY